MEIESRENLVLVTADISSTIAYNCVCFMCLSADTFGTVSEDRILLTVRQKCLMLADYHWQPDLTGCLA